MRWVPAGLFIVLTAAVGQSGCSSPAHLGDDYGQSYGLAVESQLLSPEIEPSTAPVHGLDGQAARRAVQVYLKSFDRTESQSGSATGAPSAPAASPLAGAPPSYTSAATGTMPSSPGQK
jgi:hypothetical protein